MKHRKIPMRKCTGCLEMKNKKELVRVVRSENDDGAAEFFLDYSGKKSGRGAYICPCLDCLETAHKKKGLERSFKQAVPKEVYQQMREALEKNGS